jgi:serine phosphatase RsbU (regulator of sigma subunit)
VAQRNITRRFFFIVLPLVIVPLVVSVSLVSRRFYSYLENQNIKYYSTLLGILGNNIDTVYEEYGKVLGNIFRDEKVQSAITMPPYRTLDDEWRSLDLVIDGIGNAIDEKTDGFFILFEMDRRSLFTGMEYRRFRLSKNQTPVYEKLLNDPLFLALKNDNSRKFIMGKLQHETRPSLQSDRSSVMIFPYYPVPPARPEDTFSKFSMLFLEPGFFARMFYELPDLQNGTVYLLDTNLNPHNWNHPGVEDYYDYDNESGLYLREPGDERVDPFTGLSFREYNLLNTDVAVLDNPVIQSMIKGHQETVETSLDDEAVGPERLIITHNSIEYLLVTFHAVKSDSHLVFLLPLRLVYKPVDSVLRIILAITLVMIGLILLAVILLTNLFARPIEITTNNLKLENDRNQQELEMAKQIQKKLLPPPGLKFDRISFTSAYQPMDALGGDLIDIYRVGDGVYGGMILDVCGHGVSAGLVTSMAKFMFSTASKSVSSGDLSGPSDVMGYVNRQLCDTTRKSGDYLTAFYYLVDVQAMELRYANAGHNAGIVYRDGEVIELNEGGGVYAGIVKDFNYCETVININKGDRVILYTDGIIETMNESGVIFNTSRLIQLIVDCGNYPAERFVEALLEEIKDFRGTAQVMDDIAILVADLL